MVWSYEKGEYQYNNDTDFRGNVVGNIGKDIKINRTFVKSRKGEKNTNECVRSVINGVKTF